MTLTKALTTLERRKNHLSKRIVEAEETGKDLSFDRAEVAAIMRVLREFDGETRERGED